MEKTALVTGGAGFIGSRLAASLIDGGWKVAVLDNLSSGSQDKLPQSVDFREGDVTSYEDVRGFIEDFRPEAVFHLAALHYIPACNRDPELTFRTNVWGTYNILKACRKFKPNFFFFASTAAVYPIVEVPIPEITPPAPIDVYGITKTLAEDLCHLFHLETGKPVVIGRIFNVYGPGDPIPHVIPEIIAQVLNGQESIKLGNLFPKRDFIHVEDVAEAISALANAINDDFKIFNIGTGVTTSVAEIVSICEDILGRRLKIQQDTKKVRPVERPTLCADIHKISQRLGWVPKISIRKGLGELLKGTKG